MSIEVRDNSDESRYEALLDGQPVGFAYYRSEPGRVDEGTAHALALVHSALDDVRQRGLAVVPLCPFVRSYIARHPEYDDLVP